MMGANYCDNTRLLIYVGHVGHGLWFTLCALAVLLAFNRYVEFTRPLLSERLFAGELCPGGIPLSRQNFLKMLG